MITQRCKEPETVLQLLNSLMSMTSVALHSSLSAEQFPAM